MPKGIQKPQVSQTMRKIRKLESQKYGDLRFLKDEYTFEESKNPNQIEPDTNDSTPHQ